MGDRAVTAPITGDEYMEVLAARQADWMRKRQVLCGSRGWMSRQPPPLEVFIRAVDATFVQLPDAPQPRHRRKRTYLPASYWRRRVDTLNAEMRLLTAPIVTDTAAAGGVGVGQARARTIAGREDSKLAAYCRLQCRYAHAQRKLRAAEAREAAAS